LLAVGAMIASKLVRKRSAAVGRRGVLPTAPLPWMHDSLQPVRGFANPLSPFVCSTRRRTRQAGRPRSPDLGARDLLFSLLTPVGSLARSDGFPG
jgi:hypothetical protein